MGWFGRNGAHPGGDDLAGLITVLDGPAGGTVGAGAYVSAGRFLTCAHVVNLALGRPAFDPHHPGPAKLNVGFPGSGVPSGGAARLTHWIPPRHEGTSPPPHGARRWQGDLAVLEFSESPPPGLIPLRWREMDEAQEVRARFGSGDQEHLAYGQVKSCEQGVGYVHGYPTGPSIRQGYSGGPVWSLRHGAAVGLLVASVSTADAPFRPEQTARLSWAYSWQGIRAELAHAGVEELLAPDRAHAALATPSGVRGEIRDLLEQTLPDEAQLHRHATRFAHRCALPHAQDTTAPEMDELVDVLCSVPRALPSMAEVLAPSHLNAATALRMLALRVPGLPNYLLSPLEEGSLFHSLSALPDEVRNRVPAATRNALPGHHLPDALLNGQVFDTQNNFPTYARRWVRELEEYPGDGRGIGAMAPRVPALLRAVEFVAAICPPSQRSELRQWTERMADTLGIERATLFDRRGDGDQWAESATTPAAPRLLVELSSGTGSGRTRRFDVRMWSDAGDGRLRPTSGPHGALHTPAEITRVLRKHLDRLATGVDREWPTIELVVEHGDLEIGLDAMDTREQPPLPPMMVGTRYPLVLRCPSIRRISDSHGVWQRRWRALGKRPTVLLGAAHDNYDRIAGLLDEDLDASLVVIQTPPGTRAEIAVWCLAGGMPVLLWDRGEHDTADEAIFAVDPPYKAHGLPHAVQKYRARARQSPDVHRARPVLVWDDPGRPLPQPPQLADPTERVE